MLRSGLQSSPLRITHLHVRGQELTSILTISDICALVETGMSESEACIRAPVDWQVAEEPARHALIRGRPSGSIAILARRTSGQMRTVFHTPTVLACEIKLRTGTLLVIEVFIPPASRQTEDNATPGPNWRSATGRCMRRQPLGL